MSSLHVPPGVVSLQVGGGVYILDNPALTTLGPLPNSLGTVGGLVDVGRNGAIPAAQVGALAYPCIH
jgi:hypothetical protein